MRLFLLASSLLLSLWLLPAHAQEGVHRCIGPDGTPLFTDQPCAALKATPVQAAPKAGTAAPAPNAPAPSTPPPILCATNVAQLRQSVTDAFATRDPNRLAGLMLWEGAGRNAVVSDIRSLGALMKHPLLDLGASDEAQQQPGDDTDTAERSAPAAEHQLVVHTASDDASGAPTETRFDIVRRSGCLWLRGAG